MYYKRMYKYNISILMYMVIYNIVLKYLEKGKLIENSSCEFYNLK